MKRVPKLAAEPPVLKEFREQNPDGTWKEKRGSGKPCFKNVHGSEAVFEILAAAQGRLCAYCEITIERGPRGQVEHFVPEALSTPDRNLALDPANFLAACEGGTRCDLPDDRWVPPIPETLHCGQLKGSKDLSGIVLDPREICAFPCLWTFGTDGSMSVNVTSCGVAGVDVSRAEATIVELGLDRRGLRRFREQLMVQLDEELELLLEETDDDDAFRTIAEEQLVPKDGRLPSFWSCIRYWAGEAAEHVLQAHAQRIPGLADAR